MQRILVFASLFLSHASCVRFGYSGAASGDGLVVVQGDHGYVGELGQGPDGPRGEFSTVRDLRHSERIVARDARTEGPIFQPPLVAHWRLDEANPSAGTFDSSGHNINGTCSPVNGCPVAATGLIAGAYSFDGTNDFVRFANRQEIDLPTGFSLTAWVKPSVVRASRQVVISKPLGVGGLSWALFVVDGNADGKLEVGCEIGAPSPAVTVTGAAQVPTGAWTHLACTWNGSTMQVWLNSGLQAYGTKIGVTYDTQELLIGRDWSSSGTFFAGLIDDVRIYARALTPIELAAMAKPQP